MHAVIQTGGKQYRIKEGDVFFVEKLPGDPKTQIIFDQVMLISTPGAKPQIGLPLLEKARVACEIVEQFRGKKILVFKAKRRKKSSRRRRGHRQHHTRLRVLEIAPEGQLTDRATKLTPVISAPKNSPVDFETMATTQEA